MTADYKPEGWPTVAPRLVTADAPGLVGFLRHVFGAQGELTPGRPAEMRIGDSILLVSDGGGLREASASST